MTNTRSVDYRLTIGLAALALLHPSLAVAVRLLGGSPSVLSPGWLWLTVAAAWVLVVWLTRAARPVATLVLAGVGGGVLTVTVVAVIQFITNGSALLLNTPAGMLALIGLHCLGGLVCGLVAWGLQSLTGKAATR